MSMSRFDIFCEFIFSDQSWQLNGIKWPVLFGTDSFETLGTILFVSSLKSPVEFIRTQNHAFFGGPETALRAAQNSKVLVSRFYAKGEYERGPGSSNLLRS